MDKSPDEKQSLPELPKWLTDLLPAQVEPLEINLVHGAEGGYVLTGEGLEPEYFTELTAVLEAGISREENLGKDLFISPEVHQNDNRGFFTLPIEGSDNLRLVFSYTDKDRYKNLQRNYQAFLSFAESYSNDPDNFVYAWRFVDAHPAFWTAHDLKNHPWLWETSGYMSKVRQSVYFVEGQPMVELEGGGHVNDNPESPEYYKRHYGDWRLELAAPTFEEAVLELAARVAKSFNNAGDSLPESDFPLDPPEWVLDLRERIEDMKDLASDE